MHMQVHTLEAQEIRYFTQANHAKHMPALTLPRKSFTTDNQTLVATWLMPFLYVWFVVNSGETSKGSIPGEQLWDVMIERKAFVKWNALLGW